MILNDFIADAPSSGRPRSALAGVLFPVLLALALLFPSAALSAGTMSVQVRSAQLRSRPSFLGRVLSELGYGTRVRVVGEKGGWRRVESAGGAGWLHVSALTRKRIRWRSSGAPVEGSATADELALAGKGFTPEVEKEFRRRNRDLDFTWIDRMEAFRIPPEDLAAFLEEGGIRPPEGEGGP